MSSWLGSWHRADHTAGHQQDKTQTTLMEHKDLVMLVFDERSMVSSKVIARSHFNVAHSTYGGNKSSCSWGNVPVVLFVGDDYQLPSIENGCLTIFNRQATLSSEEQEGT
jgi:hypothetical protein